LISPSLQAEVDALANQPDSLRFEKQAAVSLDPSKHKVLLSGRRAGKTVELVYEAIEALAQYERCHVVFVGLTAKSAREIFFSTICTQNVLHSWNLEINQQRMSVYDSYTRSTLLIMGSDTKADLDRIRGIERLAMLICDEAGAWRPDLLRYVVEDSAGPALMDLDGSVVISGTPNPVLEGYFFDISTGKVPGWSRHHWTALDNPHLPHAGAWIEDLKRSRGWSDDNATLRREYYAEWVIDVAGLVFRTFTDDLVKTLPAKIGGRPTRILAIDYGFTHHTAFCVLEARDDGTLHVPWSDSWFGLAPSQIADKAKATIDRWGISKVIGDTGGLGKGYAEEFKLRYTIDIQVAEKRDRLANIEMLIDGFATKGLTLDPANKELISQLRTIVWDEDHQNFAAGLSDDAVDALIYGYQYLFSTTKVGGQWKAACDALGI
jgi:hypothetical protein